MSNAYTHSTSQARLEALITDLPQSMLISGPAGVGLTGVAEYFATSLKTPLQVILPEKDDKVDIEKGVISVDSIRRLYDTTKTIETGHRIIAIDYAERMGHQAQNAFLKLLEEPGAHTHFVLLSHEPSRLLPTILSRVQILELRPITSEQSERLLDDLKITDEKKRTQLLFMATGLPAELTRLATDQDYFESRAQIVRDARQFVQGSAYERLKVSQKYKDDRTQALLLLSDAMKMIQKAVREGNSELVPVINGLLKAYDRIEANGNVRLQLSVAMV
ncbi:MAG: AAA family ATPase [Candidatus Microsaccharimonas sp.]